LVSWKNAFGHHLEKSTISPFGKNPSDAHDQNTKRQCSRRIFYEGADGCLITHGTTYEAAKPLPTVANPEHGIFEAKKFLPKVSGGIVCNHCAKEIE